MKLSFVKRGFLAATVRSFATLVLTVAVSFVTVSPAVAADDDTVSIQLPPDRMQYGPGKGVELANQYCSMCHAADYVYMQPVMNKDKWLAVVRKMKKVFGCPVADEDIDALADYLTAQNAAK